MKLRELQKQFANEVLKSIKVPSLRTNILERGIKAERRLQIYKNNINSTLVESLQNTYGISTAIVGEEYFSYLARLYAIQYPPSDGNLNNYGEQMPNFIRTIDSLAHLGYLPAIAEVDWACHRAVQAPDAKSQTVDCLASFSSESYEHLVFELHPSVGIVGSSYPIFDIWSYATGGETEHELALSSDSQSVLILSNNQQLQVLNIKSTVYNFIRQLKQKRTLGSIILSLYESISEYNLETLIYEVFSLGTISEVTIDYH